MRDEMFSAVYHDLSLMFKKMSADWRLEFGR